MWRELLAKTIERFTKGLHFFLKFFLKEEFLLRFKFIHLCWWFQKHDLPIPRYFVGTTKTAPSLTTGDASGIQATQATGNGNISSDGGDTRSWEDGFVWSVKSVNATPTRGGTGVSEVVTGTTARTGDFTGTMSSLTAGTVYCCQAFAKSTTGIAYGGVKEFTTAAATTATVSTGTSGSITQTSFIISGNNITNTGGATVTERGVVYMTGTSGDPTTSNSKSSQEGSYGTGTYDRTVSGLTASTSYRVRAFAINSVGTAYGSTITVETSAPVVPTVTTSATFGSITTTSATANGNLTNTGGASVTRRGFCYVAGTSGDPTTANSVVYDDSAGFSTGTYSKAMSSLTAEGSYRVRAYAVNSAGTGYGSTVQLTLTDAPPTVALGTNVVDTATITDTTPSFEFTGTDAGGDDIRYNIQIATDSGFSSGTSLIDSYSETNESAQYSLAQNTWTEVGQSFEVAEAATLGSVKFYLYKQGSPTGNAYAKLYAHTGTYGTSSLPTGSALATSEALDVSTLGTSATLEELTFAGGYELEASTYYVITIEYSSGGDATQNIWMKAGVDSSSPTHGGNLVRYSSSLGWGAVSGSDFIFYAYTTDSTDIVIDHTSNVETTAFVRAGDSDPFTSGQEVTYTVPGANALTADTYYWRVRGLDPGGSATYGAWSTTRSFTLDTSGGGTAANSTRSLYTKGKATSSSERSLYTKGKLTSSPERGIYTKGKVTTSSERGIYTEGSSTGTQASSERGIYSKGVATSSSERSLYTRGKLSSSSERGIYSEGEAAVENWLTGWDYRVKVTVKASEVDANLTDFPVYVDLNDLPAGFHTNVNQTDARDIRVTTSDGETEVPREVVFYTAASDTGELHFKGTISSSTDTDFYIYYGNSSASDYATNATYGAENVWNSNYKAVWHLNESSGTVYDSTSNSIDSTSVTATGRATSAQLGSGIDVSGSTDVVEFGDVLDLGTNDLTIQQWIKTSQTPTNYAFSCSKSIAAATDYRYACGIYGSTAKARLFFKGNGGSDVDFSGSTTVNDNSWKMIHWVYDRDGNGIIYVGGSSDGSSSISAFSGQDFQSNFPFRLGAYTASNNTDLTFVYNGLLDEVRILFFALSSTWISTEYNNQSSPSTFFTIGSQEEPSAGTSANSERSLYTKAKATSSSERNLYLQGKSTANSERGIYTSGYDTATSERGLYTSGVDASHSERGLYLEGSISTQSERNLYTSGVAVSDSNRSLYIQGTLDTFSERGLYLEGKSASSERGLWIFGKGWSERTLYIEGAGGGNSERGLYTAGIDTETSERNLYTEGSIDGNSERGLYLSGISTGVSERKLYIEGYDTATSERGLWIYGSIEGNSSRGLWISGKDTSSSVRDLYIAGKTTSESERNIYTEGYNTGNSERNLYIQGTSTANSERGIYLEGQSVVSERGLWLSGKEGSERRLWIEGAGGERSERSLWVAGIDTGHSERSLYLIGKLTGDSQRGVYLEGIAYGESERKLYIAGKLTDTSERGLWASGKEAQSSNRELWIKGKITAQDERSLYIEGLAVTSERNLYIEGKQGLFSIRDLWIQGKNTGTSERAIYTKGVLAGDSERGLWIEGDEKEASERELYIVGKDIGDSERSLFTQGVLADSSERGLHITGKGVGQSNRNLWVQGTDLGNSERGLYAVGGIKESSQRGLWIYGINRGSSERGLYTEGDIATFAERGLYIEGRILEYSQRGLYLKGKPRPATKGVRVTLVQKKPYIVTVQKKNQVSIEVKNVRIGLVNKKVGTQVQQKGVNITLKQR